MTPSEIRRALEELGRQPSKSLGQNFLHDRNLALALVRQITPRAGECVVEIGPGLGALTEHLLAEGAQVLAIEKDGLLAARLRERFAGAALEVVHADALDFDLRTLWPRQPVKIIGNLPYYVSSQLIFHFTSALCPAERALFLVQKEMADRLCASAGAPEYGLPSVLLGRRWVMRMGRRLPASVFYPEPKVESALVDFTLRGSARSHPETLAPCDPGVYERAARAGFGQRRKQLRKLLAAEFPGLEWPAAVSRLGVSETVRAEELDLAQWVALANVLQPFGQAQNAGERFDVVDDGDLVIGQAARAEVHARAWKHRAVYLLLRNAHGEVFLQRRSPWKDQAAGRWGSSAAGHVDAGEDYDEAVRREIGEELGVEAKDCRLEIVANLPPSAETGWEFVRLYRGRHDGPFRWPAAEVSTGAFFPEADISRWVGRRPHDFSPGFLQCWEASGGACGL